MRDVPDVTPSASSNPSVTVCVLVDQLLSRLPLDIKALVVVVRM
jgi:hypothetical protein